jgi:acyl carrier protein
MDSQGTGMSLERIRSAIKNIVSRITRIDSAEFEDQVLIREELGIDSLMITEILANCEKYLGVTIDETMLVNVETVGGFLDLVTSLKGRKLA